MRIARQVALLLLLTLSAPALAGTLTVEVLDVGQGDAILVRTPAGKTILIDAGEAPTQVRTLLKRRKVDHLDLVIATHPHADHIGGMTAVVSSLPVKLYSDSGLPHSTATYRSLMQVVESRKIPYRTAVAGTTYRLDDGATLEILFPAGDLLRGTRSDLNSNSVVARLRHQGHCFLFVGDGEEPTERALLAAKVGSCDVLKVAHHGSAHSSSDAFLDEVKPTMAIVSVGNKNGYGHPAPATLARLQARGTSVHRTDLAGTVTLRSSERGLVVETERTPAPPVSKADAPPVAEAPRHKDAAPFLNAKDAHQPGEACLFVASANGKAFHNATCEIGRRGSMKKRQCYATRADAVADRKRPAGCCEP